jgi:type I restriction enzyme R subunit
MPLRCGKSKATFAAVNNMSMTEADVEMMALEYLESMGYASLRGGDIAPGEQAAERTDYKQVFLFDRLETKLLWGELRVPAQMLRQAGAPAAKPMGARA